MKELAAIALAVIGFLVLVRVIAWTHLGYRYWRLMGSFEGAHKVIDAAYIQVGECK